MALLLALGGVPIAPAQATDDSETAQELAAEQAEEAEEAEEAADEQAEESAVGQVEEPAVEDQDEPQLEAQETDVEWHTGTYTYDNDHAIANRVVCEGDVTLILNAKLTVPAGITVSEGNSLTIQGSGTLVAGTTESEKHNAAIGGDSSHPNAGTINIKGGTITVIASNKSGGAGIGGAGVDGDDGVGGAGGTVTISGDENVIPEVTVHGGDYGGAGIGGGYGGAKGGAGGTVTISGGHVTTTGGKLCGAGIGGGLGIKEGGAGATVNITGGMVCATGGENGIEGSGAVGVGIGGGINNDDTFADAGTLSIGTGMRLYASEGSLAIDVNYYEYFKSGATSNYAGERVQGMVVNDHKARGATISYAEKSLTKTYGDAAFTNPLTNEANFDVAYTSSDEDVATIDEDGKVTLTGAGTATITASPSGDYVGESVSYSLTVNKATPKATAPTTNALTYNGNAQGLVTAGSTTGGTLQYALGDDADTAPADGWDTAVPTGTDAGIYHVWYKVVGDANHNDAEPACVEATIAKATAPDVSVPTVDAVTYDPARKLSEIALTGGWAWVDGDVVPTVGNDGYEARIAVDDDNHNYTGVEGYDPNTHAVTRTVAVTVSKAAVALSYAKTSVSKTYGDDAFTNGLTNESRVAVAYESSDTGVATVDSAGKVTVKGAGSATITATYTGDANHETASASYKLTVTEAAAPAATCDAHLRSTGDTKAVTVAGEKVATVGTTGQSRRLEAYQIVILPKGSAAPGTTSNVFEGKL